MAITIQLPAELEASLRAADPNFDANARELVLIALYKDGVLNVGGLTEALGLESRFQTEHWLHERGVSNGYTVEDLEADRKTLESFLMTAKQ